jgi:hypothetical protein
MESLTLTPPSAVAAPAAGRRYLTTPFVASHGRDGCCGTGPDGWVTIAEQRGLAARSPTRTVSESSCKARFLNLVGSLYVAIVTILTWDAILGCALAVGYTLCYWHWGQHLAAAMSWNIVSLAVIFPISQGIGMGFQRREQALVQFGHLLGNLRATWGALHTWQVKVQAADGTDEWVRIIERFDDPTAARVELRALSEEFLVSLVTYFDTTRWGRARQATPCCGHAEQQELTDITHEQRLRVDSAIGRMQRLIQRCKTLGLPGGEAHRLDQYISKVGIAFGQLCNLKEYRTPQAFRAFARVYILCIGAMYGPYYLHLSKGSDGTEENLGSALVFACGIQLAMSGLFNVMLGLEDPFARRGGRGQLDSVQVSVLVDMARRQLLAVERDGELEWAARSEPEQDWGA